MKIFDRLSNRSPSAESGSAGTTQADGDQPPIPGYDRLDHKEIGVRLAGLSQVELAAVEAYERSHKDRLEVLQKLRYMRGAEPLPGYDALSPEQIAEALAGADAQTARSVRDYERRFRNRVQVLDEVARVLPKALASPEEKLAREEQVERVREGFAGRDETAGRVASGRSAPDG